MNLDIKEWVIENDLLVNRLKEDGSKASVQNVLESFTSLLERVQGLPPDTAFICYEQAVVYNLCHLLLQGQMNVSIGGIHKSAAILHQSICRALAAFRIEPCHQGEEDFSNIHLFGPADIKCTIDTLLPALFKELIKRSIVCGPFVLSCCLLAFQWLIDEKVNQAVKLLYLMQSQLKLVDSNMNFTDEVPADRLPVCLFSLEYSSSISNSIITSSTLSAKDLTDIQSLLSVVTSLLAFALFANKEYEKALEILRGKENTHDVGFHDLYLKGYILYEQNQVDSALTCFQECLSISQEQNRAATLNMLGCCCAVKGKHHTAVAKFKDALEHDFQQLEALFNISLQYQKMDKFEAQIKALELLKEVIKARGSEPQTCQHLVVSPRDHSREHSKGNLDVELSVPPRFSLGSSKSSARMSKELVTYILAKRYSELGRFEEAATNFLELLVNIVEVRTSNFRPNVQNLPSPTELYKKCAFALCKAGRHEDAVTICDKVLTSIEHGEPTEQGHNDEIRANDKAPKKRLRSDDGEDYLSTFNSEAVSDNVQMLMLKAESLVHLQKPLEALQSLNRVLVALEDVQLVKNQERIQGHKDNDGQQRKRRKLDCGDNVSCEEQSETDNSRRPARVKVQAYNQKASILDELGQTHDALHQLHLSLECLAEHPETVYKHTRLLLKLGSNKEAAHNWLQFRGVLLHSHKGDLDSLWKVLRSSTTKFLESDVSNEQVRELDELTLNWLSENKEQNVFYPHARV